MMFLLMSFKFAKYRRYLDDISPNFVSKFAKYCWYDDISPNILYRFT